MWSDDIDILEIKSMIPFSDTLLLFLLPPSCMIVPKRDLVNTLFPYCFNPQQESFSIQQMDVEINMPRD